jgi:hypothetical protein
MIAHRITTSYRRDADLDRLLLVAHLYEICGVGSGSPILILFLKNLSISVAIVGGEAVNWRDATKAPP